MIENIYCKINYLKMKLLKIYFIFLFNLFKKKNNNKYLISKGFLFHKFIDFKKLYENFKNIIFF